MYRNRTMPPLRPKELEFIKAIENGDLKKVQNMVSDLETIRWGSPTVRRNLPIRVAVQNGQNDILKYLVNCLQANPFDMDDNHCNALSEAFENRNFKAFKIIMECKKFDPVPRIGGNEVFRQMLENIAVDIIDELREGNLELLEYADIFFNQVALCITLRHSFSLLELFQEYLWEDWRSSEQGSLKLPDNWSLPDAYRIGDINFIIVNPNPKCNGVIYLNMAKLKLAISQSEMDIKDLIHAYENSYTLIRRLHGGTGGHLANLEKIKEVILETLPDYVFKYEQPSMLSQFNFGKQKKYLEGEDQVIELSPLLNLDDSDNFQSIRERCSII